MIMTTLSVMAQGQQKPLRKFVVADMETRVPIRNAVVATKDGYRDTTNYRGICYIPETFDTLTVSRANYLTERLLLKEAKDSTFLIPNSKRISEVTIWGKDGTVAPMMDFGKAIQEGVAKNREGKAAMSIGFDLASMLDRRRRKDQKHLRKTREIFRDMDKLDDDPIVNAYKKEMERRRLESENARKLEEQKAKMLKDRQQALEEKKRQTEENGQQP